MGNSQHLHGPLEKKGKHAVNTARNAREIQETLY